MKHKKSRGAGVNVLTWVIVGAIFYVIFMQSGGENLPDDVNEFTSMNEFEEICRESGGLVYSGSNRDDDRTLCICEENDFMYCSVKYTDFRGCY